MTNTTSIACARDAASGHRRLVALGFLILSPMLVACGGARGVFSGAPYTADIDPRTVPRIESPASQSDGQAPTAQPPAVAAPPAGVEEEPIEPAPGFEVTVEPPEEVTEPAMPGQDDPAEEAAPPMAPRSEAVPPEPATATAAAEPSTSLPRPPSPDTFPNLADVPDRPTDLPTPEERARALAELQADQTEARSGAPDADGTRMP